MKKLRNYLPHWDADFRDRKYFQLTLVFIADTGFCLVLDCKIDDRKDWFKINAKKVVV